MVNLTVGKGALFLVPETQKPGAVPLAIFPPLIRLPLLIFGGNVFFVIGRKLPSNNGRKTYSL